MLIDHIYIPIMPWSRYIIVCVSVSVARAGKDWVQL